MDEEDLEELREKRKKELMEKQGSSEAEEQKKAQAEAQKKAALRKILTPEARKRLNNLKTARPKFAESVEQQLVMLASRGRVQGKIDDEKLKSMLKEAQSGKKEGFDIRRK